MGRKSQRNSTVALLDADEAFSGEWETNEFEHAAINIKSDQDGVLTISFGIKDSSGNIVSTYTENRNIYAGQGYFRPLVKLPFRYFKVDYTNGSSAQGSFVLATYYGNNLYPASASADNELLVTVTERERDAFVAMSQSNVAANAYAILVDLSDTTNFPHNRTGRIDITNAYLSIDRDSTATGFVRIGVITRIDGTDADITYFSGVTFTKSDVRQITRDRKYSPSQLKCNVVDGDTPNILSAFKAVDDTNVNTGVTLNSPRGDSTVTPAVGDIIVAYGRSAGSFNASVSCTYHSEA